MFKTSMSQVQSALKYQILNSHKIETRIMEFSRNFIQVVNISRQAGLAFRTSAWFYKMG